MKSTISNDATTNTQELPFIGKGKASEATVLFTTKASIGNARGVILSPGNTLHDIGDWVTYPLENFPPLVGTVTLEN